MPDDDEDDDVLFKIGNITVTAGPPPSREEMEICTKLREWLTDPTAPDEFIVPSIGLGAPKLH